MNSTFIPTIITNLCLSEILILTWISYTSLIIHSHTFFLNMLEINVFQLIIIKERFNPETVLNKQTHYGLDSLIFTYSMVRIQESDFVHNFHIQTNNQDCKICTTAKKRYRISWNTDNVCYCCFLLVFMLFGFFPPSLLGFHCHRKPPEI